MKKFVAFFAGAALVVASMAVWSVSAPAEAKSRQVVSDPPDCGSHVRCPGDPAPDPRTPVDLCSRHIQCPDGGDNGVDPTPDDGCVPGKCNFDSPYYDESNMAPAPSCVRGHPECNDTPDVDAPNDVPGPKVKAKTKSSTKTQAKADIPPPPDCGSHVPCPGDSVPEAKPPKAVKAQPRTVG